MKRRHYFSFHQRAKDYQLKSAKNKVNVLKGILFIIFKLCLCYYITLDVNISHLFNFSQMNRILNEFTA